jgi:hypothetical protein
MSDDQALRSLLRLADSGTARDDISDALIARAYLKRRRIRHRRAVVVTVLVLLVSATPWLIHRDHTTPSVVSIPPNPSLSMPELKLAVARQQAVVEQLLAAEQQRLLDQHLAALQAKPAIKRRIDNERESAALAIARQAACADAADAAAAYEQVATLFPQTSAAVVARARLQSSN